MCGRSGRSCSTGAVISATTVADNNNILVELTATGGNPTLPGGNQYPAVLVATAVIMGSLVSPISEEAAFRGYGQVPLERTFRPITAVALSSAFFALYHGPTQGFAPSKLFFYFVVGVVFGAIACRTNSVLPALPVHVVGDLVFFTLIWPRDSTRPLVWREGADLVFWLNVAQVIVFGTLAFVAFSRLWTRIVSAQVSSSPRMN